MSIESTGAERRRLAWRVAVIGLCALLLAAAFVIALGSGSQSIAAGDVIEALRDRESVRRSIAVIIHEVRLPRALVGALVGVNLAVSGTLLQGVVRSPLGDPYILGVSAGGGLAAAITSLELSGFPREYVPITAFVGSLVGALIVYAVAWDGSGVTTTRLALAGVALTAMIGAFTTTIVVMNVQGGGQIFFQWLVGGLYTASWPEYELIRPYSAIGLELAGAKTRSLLDVAEEAVAFGAALVPILFAYGGWQNANYVAEEIENPRRNLPLSLMLGTTAVVLIYVSVNAIYIRALGLEGLAATTTPASKAAEMMFGSLGDTFVTAAIAISTFGFLDLGILAPTRVYYAMAADGVFIPALAKLHPTYGTPWLAIAIQSTWTCVLALTGRYEQLLNYVVFAAWLFFRLTLETIL
ncbi:MAG: amino acid permease, partial [Acidobacteria bacterium]